MWRKHFEQLYKLVHDNKSKDMLYQRLANYGLIDKPFTITVKDLVECTRKQKQGKSIGPDGIAMESITHADNRLLVHLSIMFNLFLKARYVPPAFIQSTIIPYHIYRTFVLADCNREVKADVKSTLCHDQTPAIGINLCVYRMVCLRINL